MAASFFFYDLETSGISPHSARIMQFAGQATDMDLIPIGEPVNLLIKLSPDVLPEPDAIMITGITPQQTIADGLTEAGFLKYFYNHVVKPGTIFVGFNNIRFDAYEWQWKDNCSRWDLLDLVRMTRALRPDGIEWPFAAGGKPTNRLELLTIVNKLAHSQAHDALSDVQATIAVASLIKSKQPDLFSYLLENRSKQAVKELVQKATPFVYTSSHYSSKFAHTTIAIQLAKHRTQDASLVYDLRYDPTPFLSMSAGQLIKAWKYSKDPSKLRLPIKTLKYNRCPAIAPLGVIKDSETQHRLGINLDEITKNLATLKKHKAGFTDHLREAVAIMDKEREGVQAGLVDDRLTVDKRLYDSFINRTNGPAMSAIRTSGPDDLTSLESNLADARLKSLLPLYKARNFPKSLSHEERTAWEEFIASKLFAGGQSSLFAKYMSRLEELSKTKLSGGKQYLIEELKLYGESIVAADAAD
jgi:exodeoxyribonuclease-1